VEDHLWCSWSNPKEFSVSNLQRRSQKLLTPRAKIYGTIFFQKNSLILRHNSEGNISWIGNINFNTIFNGKICGIQGTNSKIFVF
jgi:hypothetical protein